MRDPENEVEDIIVYAIVQNNLSTLLKDFILFLCKHYITNNMAKLRTDINFFKLSNRLRSIYSNMATKLSGQDSIFGVVFFASKPLLGIERQKKLKNLQF